MQAVYNYNGNISFTGTLTSNFCGRNAYNYLVTDYNLLWDCIRKCLDVIEYFLKKHPGIEGWCNIKSWRSELKTMMRNLGRANGRCGKNK